MLDTPAISGVLASIKTIYDLLKSANDAQLAMKVGAEVGNIQGQLIEVQQQTLSIQQDNLQLHDQLDRYRIFTHHHSVMWRLRSDNTEDGPFCPPCHAESRDTRLALLPHYDQYRDFWVLYCPRSHVDSRAKPRGRTPPRQEPIYKVPKILIPENYFSVV